MDAFKVRSRARGFETEETFSHCLHGTLVTFKWKIKCHSAQSEFNEQKSKASKGVNFVDMWAFIDFNKINTRRFNSKSKQKTVQLLKLFSHRFAPRVVERGEWELRIEKPISINKKKQFSLIVCVFVWEIFQYSQNISTSKPNLDSRNWDMNIKNSLVDIFSVRLDDAFWGRSGYK